MTTPARVAVALPALVAPDDPTYVLEQFDIKQAAAYLGMCRCRLYQLAGDRAIAHLRDGTRRIKFSQADLDAYRAARRIEVKAVRTIDIDSTTVVRREPLRVLRPLRAVKRRRFAG